MVIGQIFIYGAKKFHSADLRQPSLVPTALLSQDLSSDWTSKLGVRKYFTLSALFVLYVWKFGSNPISNLKFHEVQIKHKRILEIILVSCAGIWLGIGS